MHQPDVLTDADREHPDCHPFGKIYHERTETLANRKIEVPVLDGTAIGVSVFRGDFQTAGSIMFLLGIGEILEEWTHKKSVGDLARSMSLNIGKVWLKKGRTRKCRYLQNLSMWMMRS